jgi:tetratricopeptide (TPR) repeat protein
MTRSMGETRPSAGPPLERAQTLCDLARFADAVGVVSQAVTQNPRDPTAWCVMARAQLGAARPKAALHAARAAISLDPSIALPHRLASSALSELGRDQEAVTEAEEATRCAPTAWQGYARLAHCLAIFRDRLPEAQAAADKALSFMPDDDPGPHLAAGAVALAAGSRDDAKAAFCAALAIDPQCGDAHSKLAALQPGEGRAAWRGLTIRPRVHLPALSLRRRRSSAS